MGKIIAVSAGRELPGKTVLGLNLALALSAQLKEKTSFLDLSFSGENTIGTLLNTKFAKTAGSLVGALSVLDGALVKGFLPDFGASISVLDGMPEGAQKSIDPARLSEAVKTISTAYPFTVVTLPDLNETLMPALINVSDIVILAVMPHFVSLKHGKEFSEAVKNWHFPAKIIKVVVNTVDSKFALDKGKIENLLSLEVFAEIPFDEGSFISSINSGSPEVISAPSGKFSNGINLITKKLVEPSLYQGFERPGSVWVTDNPPEAAKDNNIQDAQKIRWVGLRQKLHKYLIEEFNTKSIKIKELTVVKDKQANIRELSRDILQDRLSKEDISLSREERAVMIEETLDEALGLGCIEVLLKDPEITEIMVNGPNNIYVEKKGRLVFTDKSFSSATQLMTVLDRIVSPLGRRIDESSPLVDARLEDGSRVNAIIPPLSLIGPSITIRKFSKKKLDAEDLVKFGAITTDMADFLRVCVRLRKNIVVSGGTGSGKTTLLNVVSSFIPEDERIVTIEDSAELQLPQKHVIRLESRPPSIEGAGEISIRRLVINALRMRPDRIIVGECRGSETLDMLQAMNTGHNGSLTTIHSNSSKDGISRISTMVMMAGMDLPEKAIREQISSAVNIIVQLSRQSDGSRKVVEITEVTGIEDEQVTLCPVFRYEQTGLKDGKVVGRFVSMGNKPSFLDEVDTHGLQLDRNIFNKGELK